MDVGQGHFQPELAEIIAPAVGAVWPLCARSPDFDADEETAALEALPLRERLLAIIVLGPAAIVGVEPTLDHAVVRLGALGAAGALVLDALSGGQRDAATLERLWNDIERAHGDRRFSAAAALALTGVLPVAIDGVDALKKPADPDTTALVAFAVGRAARHGDPGARAIVREALQAPVFDRGVEVALVKGLGDGLFDAGLAVIAAWSRRAMFDVIGWGRATRRAVHVAAALKLGARPEPHAPGLTSAIAVGLAASEDRSEALDFIARLPPALVPQVVHEARAALPYWPSPVRAAFIAAWLAAEVELPETVAEHLLRERAASVVVTVVERVAADPARLPERARQQLARAWADHPDVHVQKVVASSGAFMRPRGHQASDDPDPSADIVALPASVMARDPIDRLRVALWSGDSDHLVELATHVPLDRRQPAREALLGALEIPNAALRRAIIEAIGRIGGQSDAPRLLDAARRYRALEGTVAAALRELNAKAAAESLAEIYRRRLKWADDDAVDDYCAIAGPEQVMHLLWALDTRYYPSARSGAARAIARKKAHEVVFALRAAGLSDTQESSRLAALGALHELTGTAPSADELAGHALLFRSSDELPEAIERAREAGHAALPGIRRTLARGSWKRRRAACDVLATMGAGRDDEASQVLIDVLSDVDEDVRLSAMEALVQRGYQGRSPRELTLMALAGRRAKDLLASPADIDLPTLVAALRLGGHVFRTEVLELLDRLVLAGNYEPAPADLALIAAARIDVGRALQRLDGIEAVLRAVDHTWQAVPHRARFVRGLADADRATLAAEAAREPWGWRAREAACQALVPVAEPCSASSAEAGAVIALLVRQIGEDDDDVRKTAFQGLAWLGTEAAADGIATGFQSPFQEDREVVAQALGAMDEPALPTIDRLMNDAWWESRQGAALALGHFRRAIGAAVDRLVVLAVDAEYRVAQAAREGLARHGLIPTSRAIVTALGQAQALTIEGLEPWLLLQLHHGSPEIALAVDALVEDAAPDRLPQRIGLIATFRVAHLALWLEDLAHGKTTRHIGVRLAAADALRALTRRACPVCRGERSVRCPGCNGSGDIPCPICQGKGLVQKPCPDPDCTARLATRPIGSKRCATCRGRGEVPAPCACQAGHAVGDDRKTPAVLGSAGGGPARVVCDVCAGAGRLACQACDGTGADRDGPSGASFREGPEPGADEPSESTPRSV